MEKANTRAALEQPQAPALAPALYVVATPIGNLGDMAPRAARVLELADVIAAEDTRVALNLLGALGIKPAGRIVSNHRFSEMRRLDELVGALRAGKSVALVSDAGTPCISDPGGALVAAAAREGVGVVAVCGASAVAAALSISGCGGGAFAFYGFFPRKKADADRALAALAREGALPVSVFFESPMRIVKTARLLASAFPGATLCVCNDLTKRYERVYRGAPADVLQELESNPAREKGEYTIVMDMDGPGAPAWTGDEAGTGAAAGTGAEEGTCAEAGTGADSGAGAEEWTCAGANGGLSLEALIVDNMVKYGNSAKDAVAALHSARARDVPKKDWFDASVRLKRLAAAMEARDG